MSIQRPRPTFGLSQEGERWVATHLETGVASHGHDPTEAVAMATEALELTGEDHEPVSEEEHRSFLEGVGIDPHKGEPIDSPDGMP